MDLEQVLEQEQGSVRALELDLELVSVLVLELVMAKGSALAYWYYRLVQTTDHL
jgi:hypothetical protein